MSIMMDENGKRSWSNFLLKTKQFEELLDQFKEMGRYDWTEYDAAWTELIEAKKDVERQR